MNFDWIDQEPKDYTKETWQYLYNEYCKTQMYGPKTKKEYYDMVMERHQKRIAREKPLSQELSQKWLKGWWKAVAFAKKRKCDMYGKDIENRRPEVDMNELADDVKELQWEIMNKGR